MRRAPEVASNPCLTSEGHLACVVVLWWCFRVLWWCLTVSGVEVVGQVGDLTVDTRVITTCNHADKPMYRQDDWQEYLALG